MTELRPYPEYKESGVKWIGEMPTEWEPVRIKYLVDLKNNINNNELLPYIGLENIESKTGKILSVNGENIESQSIKFVKGDVLFGKLRPYLAKVIQVNFAGHCSTEFLVMTPKINSKKYLMYLMLSANFISEVNSSTYGAKMPRASWEYIGNIKIPRMRECEEKQIVRFLNKKTSEIDALIADKERLIELLEEKRQAVITETVTKGLDPNVKMKDSGIEWIGEIPEHWDTIKIKFLATDNDSIFLDGDWIESDVIEDYGIRYLTTGNIGKGKFKEQTKSYISKETFEQLHCLKALPGDIAISRLNKPIGRSCILSDKEDYYIVAVDIVILRPDINNNKEFLNYCMNTVGYSENGAVMSRGTTMKRVSRTVLGNFVIPITNIEEQNSISKYLNEKTSEIDALINDVKKQISKLKEYRESLIYEAVTGKIDVRDDATEKEKAY